MKERSDSNTARVIASTSLNLLTTETVSSSLLREEKVDLFSVPLRFFIAFWIAFFTIFLEVKYFRVAIFRPPSVRLAHLFNSIQSFQVTLMAQGDVPLSIVMTVCTTLGAVPLTPLLTKILAGTYVPVDAAKLSMRTMQVVAAPILFGSYMQSAFPAVVKIVIPFAPLFAVLASCITAYFILWDSVFSENVVRLKASMVAVTLPVDLSLMAHAETVLSGEVGVVILSVLLVHIAGFFVGYISAAVCGFREAQRRAISIEFCFRFGQIGNKDIKILFLNFIVGMQNSSLGVVLATSHFTSPMVALLSALFVTIMNIMGSSLALFWRYATYSIPFNALYEIAFQVTLIAQGDVPLSIVMTVCTTLGAVPLDSATQLLILQQSSLCFLVVSFFEEYIGQLAMASMASLYIFSEGEQFDPKRLQEKMRVLFCLFILTNPVIQILPFM
ncbi:unnamed protein product [Prunus brigantina]